MINMIKQVLKTLLPDKNLSKFPKTSLNKKLSLLDLGARGGIGYPWSNAKSGNLNVILVEPDLQEVELLKKHHQGDILPYALWSKAKTKLHMLITVTLAYGYLDYADAILNVAFVDKYLSTEDKEKFIDHIRELHKSIYPFKNGLVLLYQPLQMLANCFKPTHQGWGSVDSSNQLGSRKKGFFWF